MSGRLISQDQCESCKHWGLIIPLDPLYDGYTYATICESCGDTSRVEVGVELRDDEGEAEA